MDLSRIVEAYPQPLITDKKDTDFEISPFLKRLATGKKVPDDLDYKKEDSNHLLEKYQ